MQRHQGGAGSTAVALRGTRELTSGMSEVSMLGTGTATAKEQGQGQGAGTEKQGRRGTGGKSQVTGQTSGHSVIWALQCSMR